MEGQNQGEKIRRRHFYDLTDTSTGLKEFDLAFLDSQYGQI